MACSEDAMKYNEVTDILFNAFREVIDRDTIFSIVETCNGDLNEAANVIMSITSESTEEHPAEGTECELPSSSSSNPKLTKIPQCRNKNNETTGSTSDIETINMNLPNQKNIAPLPNTSYAGIASKKRKKTVSKQTKSPFPQFLKKNVRKNRLWTEQMKRIVTYHNQGTRTLIFMRGAPGSGKSYLARQIQEMTVGAVPEDEHIFSTDDYFMANGYYNYEKENIHLAHDWTQRRACSAISEGVSPVIIDNTNIDPWEVSVYAKIGVSNGYILEVVEPNTSWARNLYQLSSRNVHGVPSHTIFRMLENLRTQTLSNLMAALNLVYPTGMQPPVRRCVPEIIPRSDEHCATESSISQQNEIENKKKKQAEHNQYTSFTSNNILNDNSNTEISESYVSSHHNEQKNDNVGEEGDHFNVVLDTEKPTVHCKEPIDNDQSRIHEAKENEIFIEKLETDISSELTDQDKTVEKVKYEDISGSQHELPSDSISHIEDENILLETSESHDSNSCGKEKINGNFDKLLEEYQQVENEWDNGEAWEEDTTTAANNKKPLTTQLSTEIASNLPRNKRTRQKENSLQLFDNENDWRKMYTPMSSIIDNNNLSTVPSKNVVEIKSTGTCIEVGDTDTSSVKEGCKVLLTTARDINLNYVPNLPEPIPQNRKFDKSSMTNEITISSGAHRCRNEDKHFIRFRNMFKYLKREELKYIFDNCCGDVNWAVGIVIDGFNNSQFDCIAPDEQSEEEEDTDEPCDCTSFYGVIPDGTADTKNEDIFNVPDNTAMSTETSNCLKKQKKDNTISDSSIELKRQIEQNIVISDEHYSEQCLKVRNMRRGVLDGDTSQNINTGITMQKPTQSDDLSAFNVNSGNTNADNQEASGSSTHEVVDSEYNSDDDDCFNEVQKTVNIKLGYDFLKQIDDLFGRGNMEYSENIEPRIVMPMYMVNEINALWMESLMSQLEAESKSHEEMIKQDEEFARELYLEQLKVRKSGKEPEIPDFKEIMDMEFALSLYRKDCEELRQKDRPTDMAAKLSAKKLYGLFPEIPQNDLDEILMAHYYDFRTTVGVLLETQGRTDITQDKDGINKFIMAQEIERQEQFVNAEKKRLAEQADPELPNTVNMDTVNCYRNKAKMHLENWNQNFDKAKYMVKKNAAVANYYNNLASLHLMQYEQANSVAAASLLQIHARNSESDTTLDLHFLRVDEAKAALEMFLDSHIQRLRMAEDRDGQTIMLFIITGRGLHSRGGPKIKPAVKIQLRHRKLFYKELNPGLLSVRITFKDKLSYQFS